MYERFTDRTRKVMILANQEAQRLKHEYIGTEHILLGLLKEGSGVAAHVLQDRTLDSRIIARAVETLLQSGPTMTDVPPFPRSPRAKKVIEYSMEESRNLHHGYVGTEHILLGLLREQEGVAAQVLATFGLEVEGVREEIRRVLNRPYDWGRKQYPVLPPMRPVEECIAADVEPPAVCPKCGETQVVRVLWRWVHLFGKNQEDVATGRAILGSQAPVQGPPWVCLRCAPAWREVHRLALQDYEWQMAKEKAITSGDFDAAAKYRDGQTDLRLKRDSLLEELLRNQ